jgi:hypothetical protein
MSAEVVYVEIVTGPGAQDFVFRVLHASELRSGTKLDTVQEEKELKEWTKRKVSRCFYTNPSRSRQIMNDNHN